MDKSKEIKARLQQADKRFWAGDNISDFIKDGEKQVLIDAVSYTHLTLPTILLV